MSLLEKIKLRSFEKSLLINQHVTPKGSDFNFNKVKSITILIESQYLDKDFRLFIDTLKKRATVHLVTLEHINDKKAIEDSNSFNDGNITWGHLPPDHICSKWQSFKTDMVINFFNEESKSLIYLSAILKQSFSVGIFENKWLQNEITISLKKHSSKEFSNMFFYLLQTTAKV